MGQGVIRQWVWIALLAAINNLSWAIHLMWSPKEVGGVTALVIPLRIFGLVPLIVLLAASSLIVLATPTLPERRAHFLVVGTAYFTQLGLVILSAIGSVIAAASGAYLDGTVVPTAHIDADQQIYVFLALLHFIAAVQICWEMRKRT